MSMTLDHVEEKLGEAVVRMGTAAQAIVDAHSVACSDAPVLAVALGELIGPARAVASLLRQLLAALAEGRP